MAPEHWLRIKGGDVIDGAGNPPASSTDVIVRDNRIVAVGDRTLPDVVLPPVEEMETIEASGMTVMPGLIDSHCHMSYGAGQTQEEIDMYTSHELKTLLAAANAEKVLRAGVTSVSSPGGSYFIDVGIREGVNRGWIKGPRIKAAGRYLTTSNGLTDWYPTSVGVPDGGIGRLTNTVDEMKDEIRRQVKNGVDLIKLSDSAYGQLQAFTNDEMKQVAELTHNLGRPCTIHARASAEVSAAIDAGFDWIMHGNIMSDDVIEKLAESKTPLVPTLLLLANRADWPEHTGGSRNVVDGARRMLDRSADTYHRALAAGVTFVMGSDSGFSVTPYGEWHAREIELLSTYAGLSPLEAITTATKNGARIMGLDGELGEITPGYLADIIVVKGNPADNLRVLINKKNIVSVVKDGRVVEFSPGLDDRSFHVDRLPIVYSTSELTYDMVFSGSEGTTYRMLPWSAPDAKDLARELTQASAGPVQH
jgi:imidazolonepropionase-like amidohydrolase